MKPIDNQIRELLRTQHPSGAFPSTIHLGHAKITDWNGFVTAQVLRAINNLPEKPLLRTIKQRALDFLEQCRSPSLPGAYTFWPSGGHPAWMKQLPADSDDTSVMALELAYHDRLDKEAVRRIACKVLLKHRLRRVDEPHPSWLRPGVFLTWLTPAGVNMIDCCANANVVALLAFASLLHLPGVDQACGMIENGIRWAGNSLRRARALTPFYPHPTELLRAVDNAVDCGAEQLRTSLKLLRNLTWAGPGNKTGPDQPVCSSAHGHIVWTAPALMRARYLRDSYGSI